jgi:hypothetical protein
LFAVKGEGAAALRVRGREGERTMANSVKINKSKTKNKVRLFKREARRTGPRMKMTLPCMTWHWIDTSQMGE